MIKVIVLGTGNVGTQFVHAFTKAKEIALVQVYSRKSSALLDIPQFIKTTTSIANLKDADVYIIAISDDAISEFSSQLSFKKRLVVHTSGSISMNMLQSKSNIGVFYPLQTFTKDTIINLEKVPICIESKKEKDLVLLEKLASAISNHVYYIDSAQRKQIHLAAVFVNNFVNHLYKIGSDICAEHHIPLEILKPLIQETARKIINTNPLDAQTGPARRNDIQTIQAHLAILSSKNKEIYKLLTQSIQQTYGKKL